MLMALAILGIGEPALGHDYQVLVGVTSNVLLTRGKVVLAQSDGSLTALDGDTGDVLARVAGDFSGHLTAVQGVIVRRADWEVAVLDGDTFDLRWRAPAAAVWTLGSALVVRQRGSIAKLDLATGREVWRYPFEQPHSLVLAGERALVFRDRTERWNAERDDFDALGAAFAVLDLQTGEVSSRVDYPLSDSRIREAYFDGNHVYLARGTCETPVEDLEVLDISGTAIGNAIGDVLRPPSDSQSRSQRWSRPERFQIGGLSFLESGLVCRSGVPCKDGSIAPRPHPLRAAGPAPWTEQILDRFESARAADSSVRLKVSDGPDIVYSAPHLSLEGASTAATAATSNLVVVATTAGVVDGIERDTGKILWRYLFAPRWRHIPGCALGPRSYTTELHDKDQATLLARRRALESQGLSALTRTDPESTPRYPYLWLQRLGAKAVALLPLLIPALVLLRQRMSRDRLEAAHVARAFAWSGPTVLLVVFVSGIERCTPLIAAVAWLASVVLAIILGTLSSGSGVARILTLTVGTTLTGLLLALMGGL